MSNSGLPWRVVAPIEALSWTVRYVFHAMFYTSLSKGTSMSRSLTMVCCVLSLLFSIVGAASATTYTFQDLGAIDGLNNSWESYGFAINSWGWVTGITGSGGNADAVFLYSNGAASLLASGGGGDGYGINASGAVAGNINRSVPRIHRSRRRRCGPAPARR